MVMLVLSLPPTDPSISVQLQVAERYLDQLDQSDPKLAVCAFWLRAKILECRTRTPAAPTTPDSAELKKAQQDLVAFFGCHQAQTWLDRDLGFEIWRREVDEHFGDAQCLEKGARRLSALLESGDSNWHTILYLIKYAVKCYEPPTMLANGEKEHAPSNLPSELLRLVQDQLNRLASDPATRKERGYSLGLLELHLQYTTKAEISTSGKHTIGSSRSRLMLYIEGLLELIPRYYDLFGSKICCFEDLLPYLRMLSQDQGNQLLRQLKSSDDQVCLSSMVFDLTDVIGRRRKLG